jgi:S-adenosylhomocysteine hydrolase
MIASRVVVVCGCGDVGEGCVIALKVVGTKVIVIDIDPIYSLQVIMGMIEIIQGYFLCHVR